jgi:hypothetical protein
MTLLESANVCRKTRAPYSSRNPMTHSPNIAESMVKTHRTRAPYLLRGQHLEWFRVCVRGTIDLELDGYSRLQCVGALGHTTGGGGGGQQACSGYGR